MNIQAKLTGINRAEAMRYLGYRGQELSKGDTVAIDRCVEAVMQTASPKLVWKRVPIDSCPCIEGEDLARHLAGCDEVALMAVTLGVDIDRLISKLGVKNPADALIIDSCASAAIENVADNFESDLRPALASKHRSLTKRYSPGYGDLPIEVQRDLCAYLDTAHAIGLTLSHSLMMIPTKSVTAFLGIRTD